ncbi:phosphate-starvation-inducible PsiE family protein [Chromatocurvus halotolerans]|uniref:Protein PsiE n=1 Tax=Chromatocurvus halotolerans TaxID=1132028 RepID=A0A4R2KTJ1_9GAMM|nr:phosphate-starvation-inducible PsiE family protein [Chromatocurvus halotolerans]TCO77144.1 protein PsiE [Chromatocurvus halotolerans]
MLVGATIGFIERAIIILIVILTVGAVGLEVLNIWDRRTIVIADILLLFLYTEVISMASVFYTSRRIPVVYPLLIAITAISRLIVLQSKDMDPVSILYEATAALILGVAAVLLTWSERTAKHNTDHTPDNDNS